MSRPREELGLWLTTQGFVPEVRLAGLSGKRRFRFDWARDERPAGPAVAVEYDGMGVGHQSISGTWADAEKSNEAQLCGWLLIRCNARTWQDGKCQAWVEAALGTAP